MTDVNELANEAKAAALADYLEEWTDVEAWRDEHLADGYLAGDALTGWVEANSKGEGEPGPVIHVLLPGAEFRPSSATVAATPAGTLATLVERLQRLTNYPRPHLTTFVLTGRLWPAERVLVGRDAHALMPPTAARVELSIDPAVPVKDVAAAYAAERKRLFGGGRPPRRPNERLLRLLVHDRQQPADSTREERAAAWDDWCREHGHDDWTFGDRRRHYSLEVDQTRRRMLYGSDTERGDAIEALREWADQDTKEQA